MSIYAGTAANYTDLLGILNSVLTQGHTLPISWTGSGNGTLQSLTGTPSSVQDPF